ncbi:MAG: hypothetical protein U5O15_04035 [Candidatus Krumholzibacteriota bacterium]|nr:hypothetical protein [Candidatus Krumholzibacteriota bacterium]
MELIFSFYPAIGIIKNAVYFPCEEIASPALRLALSHFLGGNGKTMPARLPRGF